jgi:hypothetical protein
MKTSRHPQEIELRVDRAKALRTPMKITMVIVICLPLVLICPSCQTQPTTKSISVGGGFIVQGHSYGSSEKGAWTGLRYQNQGKEKVVWPYLGPAWGAAFQLNQNTAVLIGGIAAPYADGRERLTERLLAFEAPNGPTVDITDQVFIPWCNRNGFSITNVVRDGFHSVVNTNGLLQIIFLVTENNLARTRVMGTNLFIAWSEIGNIIADAKSKGHMVKEKWSGVEYLEPN